jgi:uncharacterized protein
MKFFILVFGLSIPFWLIGYYTELQLLPGLPISSLMVFCPMLAASILVYRERKIYGVTELFKSAFDNWRFRAKSWYLAGILVMPGIAVVAFGLMRMLNVPLPIQHIQALSSLVLFLMFFIAALSEEIGWTGYAIDPMQDRWSALQSSILLGILWAIWHIVPFMQVERSLMWIAWQCLTLVASRVLIVWLYNNSGKSLLVAILCHTMINVSWQLFPNHGSHYNPFITGLITTLVVIGIIAWGPKTLSLRKNS